MGVVGGGKEVHAQWVNGEVLEILQETQHCDYDTTIGGMARIQGGSSAFRFEHYRSFRFDIGWFWG